MWLENVLSIISVLWNALKLICGLYMANFLKYFIVLEKNVLSNGRICSLGQLSLGLIFKSYIIMFVFLSVAERSLLKS